MSIARALVGVAAALCICLPAAAQYPNKPIRLVVPFAPGGSSDIISRAFAQEMSKTLGQSVVVESKPGGAGNIAMQEVAKSAPDGYNVILTHVGTMAVNPAMFARLPYDPIKDFTPISMLASVPSLIVVHPGVKANNLKELVALVKASPGKINYASAGNGSSGHLAMSYFAQTAGLDMQHVPYKGTGPMMTDLLAGRLETTFTGMPPLLQHVKSGKLRPIAVGTAKRSSALPDVPTVAEQGYPGFETSQWYGLHAPAGTPREVIDRLVKAVADAAREPAVAERLAAESALVAPSSPEAYGAFVKAEMARWGLVVKKANIKAD
jgi:tripartite-type tricarboxylate transporter receptor subunit TctC